MIIDTSAVVAILRAEPDAVDYLRAMRGSASARMSAATYVECGIVIDLRRKPTLSAELDDLLARTSTTLVDVTATQARVARQAYRDFGKGSGHPAQLNYGDCFSYALAVETREPLLFKGNDFAHAGIRNALSSP